MRTLANAAMNRPARFPLGITLRHGPRCVQMVLIAGLSSLLIAGQGLAQTNAIAPNSEATRNIAADLKRLTLDVSSARSVHRTNLTIPMGAMRLESGLLFPATAVGGAIAEFVFVGHGTLEHAPVDSVERAQLEFFSGDQTLDADFSAAAFVVPNNDAATAFMKLPAATPDAAALERASKTWERWKNGAERKLLGIEGTLFADGAGDPFQRAFFVVFARDEDLGDFVYSFDPSASEQLTIAQFVPLEATEKEKRRLRKILDRQQRQGRIIGVTVEDLGEWDVWLSSSNNKDGAPARGVVPFESTHYVLDVTIGPGERISGKATIAFRAASDVAPAATFHLPTPLVVQSVTSLEGKPLSHFRDGSNLVVILPRTPATNEVSTVIIGYAGKFLERAPSKTTVPVDSLSWHPRIGERDRATYDVTYRWRGGAELVAGGKRVDAPAADGHIERWQLTIPSFGTTFALGSFRKSKFDAGHIHISLALDSDAYALEKWTRDEVVDALRDSIVFFEEKFGSLPFNELNVVNVPRSSSQSLSGIITLSTIMLGEYSSLASALLHIEDRRTVVAHEVAHFWWGHQVGYQTYRDQWITEALASYAASLFAREKLDWAGRFRVGPTTGWQYHLAGQLDSGRALESVGPLVLGARLDSSRGNAYTPIVYMKGELVIEMIARRFGSDVFNRLLTAVAKDSAGAPLSTENLVEILSRAGKADFSSFAQQFIYGTGIPTISYTYSFAPSGPNKWVVKGEARRITPVETRFKVVRLPNGRLDVVKERLPGRDRALETVVVPFKIGVNREGGTQKLSREQRKEYEKTGNATVFGRLFLDRENTPFEVEVENEPKILRLDREEEVFARFLSEVRSGKRVQIHRAYALLAVGKTAEAEVALRDAIAAEDTIDADFDIDSSVMSRRELLELENQLLDAEAHLILAELSLSGGDFAAMRSEVEQARKSLSRGRRGWIDDEVLVLEARAELLSGEVEQAFTRLKKFVLKRNKIDHGQAYALLAITAKQTGHQAEYEKAVERARRRGIDVTLLK